MPLSERMPLTPATRQWPVWSTTARIVVTEPAVADAAEQVVRAELDRIDRACSRFRPDSELAAAQREPGPVRVGPLLADLIGAALRAAERTGGDVDPTLACDLVDLGYDRDLSSISLAGNDIRITTRTRHDWRAIRLDGDRLTLPPGVTLDLGATAKARAADRCAARVAAELDCGVLVALGGDVAVAGAVPALGWQLHVQDGDREPAQRISLFSGGLATSSTLARRWGSGTRWSHHILDPVTGAPADPVWRTVSVVAGDCVRANTLATAAVVRGRRAPALLRAAGVAARLVDRHGAVLLLGPWPPSRDHANVQPPDPRRDHIERLRGAVFHGHGAGSAA